MKPSLNIVRLKGSALLNAVTVSVIVALFCSALIGLWYSNTLIVQRHQEHIQLVEEHQYAVQQFLATIVVVQDADLNYPVFDHQGVHSTYTLKPWGIYKVLTVNSFTKNDSLSKSFLLGNTSPKSLNGDLFLLDRGKPLKYAGDVSFSQNITIPNSSITPHFLPKIKNNLKRTGKVLPSSEQLPKISLQPNDYEFYTENSISIEQIEDEGGVLIQSFDQETVLITIAGNYELRDITLKGNIVSVSYTHLTLPTKA